jgi:hypothetical protein
VVDGGYDRDHEHGARRWVADVAVPPAAVVSVWWGAEMNHPVLTVVLLGIL